MTQSRTFKIKDPLMHGDDIEAWQKDLLAVAASWNIRIPLKADGVYGLATRSFSKMICFGLGFKHDQLDNGITPWVRLVVRNPNERTEGIRKRLEERQDFRDSLRAKFSDDDDVAAPIGKIITMTWGYHPGVHDGVDLICGPSAPIFAICDARVIDVRASGWWGNNPSGEIWRGDGIIQIESLTDDGPFKRGMHFGYGHAEGADVKVGQTVEAGERLGEAGLAVAWHVHFMANNGEFGLQGRGSMDPVPFVEYALKKG